ncbi:GAF domain-containing protein [Georgenia sp. Z1491]|uniref:GAF domain-containing sensor histidine kinase n=1 Tax=Georgenia sp. Z1491 TaxID=3416707 RepID=UPI003CEC66B0
MHELDDEVLGTALTLTGHLEVRGALDGLVASAAALTGARYAALGVLDSNGETQTFIQVGMSEQEMRALGHPPSGTGVLGAIPAHGALVLDDLTEHPDFGGFPPGHPPMHSFLGVPVRAGGRLYGRLYLAEKEGGHFTPADVTTAITLARATGVAVANATTYGAAQTRARWTAVANEITTALLEGSDEDEALELVATRLLEVAEADTVILVLPSVGDTWVAEIVRGDRAGELLGVVFPSEGRAQTVIRERSGLIVDSLTRSRTMRVPELASFGPALYAPMLLSGEAEGVLLLLRHHGRPEFTELELEIAQQVASQAVLALQIAGARHVEDVATMVEERARISRDLHDLAIQQLFATGMQLTQARARAEDLENRGVGRSGTASGSGAAHGSGPADASTGARELTELIDSAVDAVDSSVRQIRSIVHNLREPDQAVLLAERLRREASLARTTLGFAPSLLVEVDGRLLADDDLGGPMSDTLRERVDPDVADDVVAVVREGVSNAARHAGASSVSVHLRVRGSGPAGTVLVEVIDDGRGIPADRTRSSGLGNLAQRARRHGGTFSVGRTETGRGTLLQWQVPTARRG